MFAILVDPVRADLHLRPVRRQPAPGLDDLRGDGRRSSSSAPSSRCTASTPATRCSRPASTRPARQHGGQGGPLRGRASAACSRRSRPARAPARSTPGTTASSRSPASSRCSTSSSARSRPGGIGAGMYGMLVIGAILAVFIAGLMVGRTPEYLGKKVEAFEMKMAMLVALVLGASILGFTALASVLPEGSAGPLNPGPHGFSEILYAFSQPDRQQRLGLRRADRQHALLQHHRRPRDAHRPLRDDRPDPGPRRLDGGQAPRRAVARHVPDDRRPVDRPADRRRDHRRRADLLPGAVARARSSSSSSRTPERPSDEPDRSLMSVDLGRGTRRFQRFVDARRREASRREPPRPRGVLDPDLLRSALPHAFRKLDPRLLIKNPVMFVVEITAVLVTLIALGERRPASSRSTGPAGLGFQVQIADLAVVHRPVRDLRRGRRRGARPGPGGDAPQDALGDDRPSPPRRRHARGRRLVRAAQGRHHRRRGGRDDPRRRRRHRGRRLRQRGRDHRRVGAGPQGAGHRHPQLGHRRHDARPATGSSSASRPTPARRSSTG